MSTHGRNDVPELTMAVVRPPVADLLGLLCYGALVAFDNLAVDARLAPDLRRRAALSQMAAAELSSYRRLADRLGELGVDPVDAMGPFVRSLDAYHASTRPCDWLEGLVKAYVGDGIADDFYRQVAGGLTGPDRSLVLEVLHDGRHAGFAVAEVRAAICAEAALAGRLALWARRLVGEAVAQATQVVAERPALAELANSFETDGPTALVTLIERLTASHVDRMNRLGLRN